MQHDADGIDVLTGLPTTQNFVHQAQELLAAKNRSDLCKTLVFFDIINLKSVNAELGYHRGDEALIHLAGLIREQFPNDIYARLSDDNYVVLTGLDDVEDRISSIYRDALRFFPDVMLRVVAGIYMIGPEDTDVNAITDRARIACDSIKDRSFEYMRYYDKGLSEVIERRKYVIDNLDDAIAADEIKVYYMPVMRVLSGKICGVECLARWDSPRYGMMPPDFFVSTLERNRMIHKLDLAVLRRSAKLYHKARERAPFFTGSVNLSRLDFELCDIFEEVEKILREEDVPRSALHIEVTESMLTDHAGLAYEGVERFRAAGYEVWMDDFGSGYSSLNTLGDLAFDTIKFDMKFMHNLSKSERSRIVYADAVNMVKQLGMGTVAEGVENEEQLEFLKTIGCDKAQGWMFGRPMSYDEFVKWFNEGNYEGETAEDLAYYNKLSQINVLAPDRLGETFDAQADYSSMPTAIVEIRGQRIDTLTSNDAYRQFLNGLGVETIGELTDRVAAISDDMVSDILYVTSKAKATGECERFDFMVDGSYCDLNFRYIVSNEGADAFLVQALNLSRFSAIERSAELEASLHFLYSSYERIDMLDYTSHLIRNIHQHASVYSGLSEEWLPIEDETARYAQLAVHPDDRERYMTFFNLETVKQRMKSTTSNRLCTLFNTLSDQGRYSVCIYTLIPMKVEGRFRALVCVRRASPQDYAALGEFNNGVSDSKLLSAMLNNFDRPIFWMDDKRRFLGANQLLLDYFGIESLVDIVGKTADEAGLSRPDGPLAKNENRILREGIGSRDVKGVARFGNNNREILMSEVPLYHGTKVVGILGYFRYADEV